MLSQVSISWLVAGIPEFNTAMCFAGVRNYVWRWKKEEERWAHIMSPCPFVDIAAGNDDTVWAVDRNKEMWWLHD